MTPASPAAPAGAADLRAQARAFWDTRAPREQRILLIAALLILLSAIWSIAVGPAWRTLRAAPAEIAALDARLQRMRDTAAEVNALRGTPPVGSLQSAAALKSATDRLGTRATLLQQGDRATVRFQGVSTEDLRSWLLEARNAARARPLEVQLTRTGEGYDGSMTLSVGGAP